MNHHIFPARGLSRRRADQLMNNKLEGYQKIVGNHSQYPGEAGFPMGVCPEHAVPGGMQPLAGYTEPTDDHYGNYKFREGSITCYHPVTWCKEGDGTNGLAVNEKDVKPYNHFSSAAEAAAAGYWIDEVFWDGGELKLGFFVDKYLCSKNIWGDGYVASSIANGKPISTHADHNPIADLTACSGNYYYEVINAAHARDGVDGAVNPDSIFFANARKIQAYLNFCAMAHAQASLNNTNCAWFDETGVANYPKGCNDNALGDVDDGAVSFTSDEYSNCARTGSGVPFSKTTHNGQACGVADVNGLMWEIALGVTCIAVSKTITGVTKTDPCQLTIPGHGQVTGALAMIVSAGGTTELNDRIYQITKVDDDTISLDGVDATGFTDFTTGGTITFGKFYKAKKSVAMKDFTAGASGVTDHWGTVGVAAMMDEFDMVFETRYPHNVFALRLGDGANQVLSSDPDGNGAVLRSLGIPLDADGLSSSGSNLYGQDYFYQYIRDQLCLRWSGDWSNSSNSGPGALHWHSGRAYSSTNVSFRCACYSEE
jgi:hypothetical protein